MKWVLFFNFFFLVLLPSYTIGDEVWRVSAYCPNECCCKQYADGEFASGRKVYVGACAINWLKFGTKVKIHTLGVYVVEDRGAKSIFGTKKKPKKAVDIFFKTHKEARKFGIKHLPVEVLV